jgi:hypothetical protein
MTLPSPLAKRLQLDPMETIFLLKVMGQNKLELKILNTKDLDNYGDNKMLSADHVSNPIQQTTTGAVI